MRIQPFKAAVLVLAFCGCSPPSQNGPGVIHRSETTSSDASSTPRPEADELESLKVHLLETTWAYTSGTGAFTVSWVFRFNADGTYWFTIVSDFTHTPVKGRWTLDRSEEQQIILKLSELEKGDYYYIKQTSYPRYHSEGKTFQFPASPDGNSETFHPWPTFDWDLWRKHIYPGGKAK